MKKALYIATAGLLFIFLILNILSSQSISPLYFDLMKRDSQAAVSFLQQIKQLSDFDHYKKMFSSDIQRQFLVEERRKNAEIQRLQGLLIKNPYSRDVLYNLYLIFDQSGDKTKANDYLKRAKAVDPDIK